MNYDDTTWPGGTEPFYPREVLRHCFIVAVVLAPFAAIVFFFPNLFQLPDLPADPSITPYHIKPEWYFLPLYQFLKLIPSFGALTGFAGICLVLLFMALVIFLPFLDRSSERDIRKRPVLLAISIVVILAVTILGIWGAIS